VTALLLAGASLSCESGGGNGSDPNPSNPVVRDGQSGGPPATAPAGCTEAALRERATRMWSAKVERDARTWYELTDPRQTRDSTLEQFQTFIDTREPFVMQKYALGRVITEDGYMGWVEVTYTCTIRLAPDNPPREATMQEKWHCLDGHWYPVPRSELEQFPLPPYQRDLAEEELLRKRIDELWEIRQTSDYGRMYDELVDPRDHQRYARDQFMEAENKATFIEHNVHWVEVRGGSRSGTSRIAYRFKVNDPSLQNLPPQVRVANEDWVKIDDQWYYDLAKGPLP
jgi:hypothetical protein